MTAPTKGKPGAQAKQQTRPRSFLVGTQQVIEGNDYDQSVNPGTSTNLPPWALTATGWLRGLWLLFNGTGLTAGTVSENGPFNVISNIELDDVNNEAIFGPFDGYTAYLTNKYGGYYFSEDPGVSPNYAYTGTVNTNNFTFALYIPLEIVNRDPIGPVASVNNTASLTLKVTLSTQVFTATTGTLAVRMRGTQDFYWEPRRADRQGNPISAEPPASGTTQYWTQGSVAIAGAGTINQPLNTGLGYPFRQYLFMYVATTRASGETNWPDPLIGLKFEANMLLSNYNKALWRELMFRQTGFSNAADTRGTGGKVPGFENGVFALFWNDDFFLNKNGGETRRSYLVTSPGSNFIFNGAMGAAGNLYSIVNYVAPGGGAQARSNTAALTGGQ